MTRPYRHKLLNLRLNLKEFFLTWMILWGCCFALPVWGQEELHNLPWTQLAPEEQTVLSPFKEQWESFPPSRQHRLQHGAQRYQQMTPTEQQLMRKRFNRWKAIPLEKQERIRQRFKAFRQLPPNKQQMLLEKRRWFQDLPLERRQELKNRWKSLSPQRRKQIRERMGKPHTRPN